MTPEQVRFEYVQLTQDALAGQIAVDPAEVKAQYDTNAANFGQSEQRAASHILITVKPDASDAEKAAAKKKAEDLLAQARAAPAKFAELAKQYSQDPGSAPSWIRLAELQEALGRGAEAAESRTEAARHAATRAPGSRGGRS